MERMTGFVSSVEFADGTMWIPSRADLGIPQLQRVMAPSDEEQRLVQIYSQKGIKGLIAELNPFVVQTSSKSHHAHRQPGSGCYCFCSIPTNGLRAANRSEHL